MRIVIDLQGAQCGSRHRGIGRYSLALAQAMVRNAGSHEIIIALNGLFAETVEPIRAAFNGLLPQENIRVWYAHGPVHAFDKKNNWRRASAELIREAFLASLQPDIVHITSLIEGFGDDAVHSINLSAMHVPTAVTFYDLIPLIQSDVYLTPNPSFETLYREKIEHLSKADLYLAISDSSRLEALQYLHVPAERAVNIAAAADACFKKIQIPDHNQSVLRKKFGLTRPFLMYSGATDERKNHLRLIKAFSLLPAQLRSSHQLAIVGGLPTEHRRKFEAYAKFCGLLPDEVIITGRVSDDELVCFYNLCKLFIFPSWHEGFGLPALEAMSCGAPVIGANTTSVPEVIGRSDALFDPFNEKLIAKKIAQALQDDGFRADLATHGLDYARNFSWDISAKKALTAFEEWHSQNKQSRNEEKKNQSTYDFASWLIEKIALLGYTPTDENDWIKTAEYIARNHPTASEKQLFIDISELVNRDAKTGVQRVVRSVLVELIANPPKGFRIEPIYTTHEQSGYRYARKFSKQTFNLTYSDNELNDDPVDAISGDIFIGLDLHHAVMQQSNFYSYLKCIGVKSYYIVYDLAPVLLPEFFPSAIPSLHAQWLGSVANADGAICISRAVADEMADWLNAYGPKRLRPLKLGYFHLGADLAQSMPSVGLPSDASHVLDTIASAPTFLMVGTIEPRKGHMQTLAAFEQLWNQGINVNLVIVGKQGWNVDLLVELLRNHSEKNIRLFWLEGISDQYLEKVYATATCLIAPSEAEGFGLPLIEAAQHKLPIIARDLPVFREVAGENAYYFSGNTPESIANTVRAWLAIQSSGQTPQSGDIPWLTWKKSTQTLLNVVLADHWYKEWMPDNVCRIWGSDHRLGTQVGKRKGRDIVSTGNAGYLIFGPYIPLAAGKYRVALYGTLGQGVAADANIDVVIDGGKLILDKSLITESVVDDSLASLAISLDVGCTDLEIRVWVSNNSDLTISMIEIAPCLEELEDETPLEELTNGSPMSHASLNPSTSSSASTDNQNVAKSMTESPVADLALALKEVLSTNPAENDTAPTLDSQNAAPNSNVERKWANTKRKKKR